MQWPLQGLICETLTCNVIVLTDRLWPSGLGNCTYVRGLQFQTFGHQNLRSIVLLSMVPSKFETWLKFEVFKQSFSFFFALFQPWLIREVLGVKFWLQDCFWKLKLGLIKYDWVKSHFPLISPFTGNIKIIRFSKVALVSFATEKREVLLGKTLNCW